MKKNLVAVALYSALAVIALPVAAEQVQAQFTVSVNVPARATLQAIGQVDQLVVTTQDVERGYLDVAARYRVEHNTRQGYLLRFSPRVGLTRAIEVRGTSGDFVVREDSVEIHQQRAARRTDLDLQFRFVLDPDVPPGRYPLPIVVAATPL